MCWSFLEWKSFRGPFHERPRRLSTVQRSAPAVKPKRSEKFLSKRGRGAVKRHVRSVFARSNKRLRRRINAFVSSHNQRQRTCIKRLLKSRGCKMGRTN